MGALPCRGLGLDLLGPAVGQYRPYLGEPRPGGGLVPPAIPHQVVMVEGATIRLFQSLEVGFVDRFQNLLSRERRPRLKAVREHLPERDSERPDVARRGESEVADALGGAPRYRQLEIHVEVGLVVVFALTESPAQAEVGDLHFALGED